MKCVYRSIFKLMLFGLAFGIVGCAPQRSPLVDQASQALTQALGCADMKSLVFDSFYQMIDQGKTVPTAESMKESLKIEMNQLKIDKKFSTEESQTLDQITEQFFQVIDLMLTQKSDMTLSSWKEQIQMIIEYEMQDRSSKQIISSTHKINQALDKVKALSTALSISCQISYRPHSISQSADVEPLTGGLNRVFATAYQSCRVIDLPPIDRATSDVVGITRLSESHPDGIGAKRIITNLEAVQNTHYYIRNIATDSSCIKVSDNPLIYDYGGEPAILGNTLNYFKNAGTGTEALGVDCSAFVSSAIAVSGFRYKPNLANKPIYTRQSSSKFINAATSGFTCFDNVTVSPKQSILPGDIIGVKGHVVIVDQIGKDPFGLALIKNESDCSRLNYKNFDIVIAQSSPSKNGIGLNKYQLSDYLDETMKMRTAFVEMGTQACLAHFQNKSIKPQNTEWGFLRHVGTSECSAPRVNLVGESCVKRCQALFHLKN